MRSSHECRSHARFANDLYVPFSFVVFNAGDLAGRIVSERVPVETVSNFSRKLNVAAISRLAFFPLLLLCVSDSAERHATQIQSDAYSFLVQFSFAFTNGILVSCSFVHGLGLAARTAGMQERASKMLTFAVYFGLLSGSMLSFPVSRL